LRATGQIVTTDRTGTISGVPFFARFDLPGRGTPIAHHARAMKKILIVEDNEVVQDILRQFFEPRYRVQVAGNASQALSIIVRGAPDVALLDIKMPGLDGISLLKSLREMGVTVPIFIMTGYDSLQVAQDVLNAGANGYLPKPFDLLHLDRLVADACGTDALQPPSVTAR
jgi:CheY-like chemotaxis protein